MHELREVHIAALDLRRLASRAVAGEFVAPVRPPHGGPVLGDQAGEAQAAAA